VLFIKPKRFVRLLWKACKSLIWRAINLKEENFSKLTERGDEEGIPLSHKLISAYSCVVAWIITSPREDHSHTLLFIATRFNKTFR